MVDCRICNSEVELKYQIKLFTYYYCQNCSSLQVYPKPSDEILKAIYNSDYFNKQKYFDKSSLHYEYDFRLNLIKSYHNEKKVGKILEIGCGIGDFINYSKNKLEAKWYGIDISEDAIKIAKTINEDISNNFYACDIINFTERLFDIIVMWDTIEHIYDIKEFLIFLSKLLVDKGVIILSTPDTESILGKIMKKYWYFITPPEHLTLMSKKSFQIICDTTSQYYLEYWYRKGKKVNIGFAIYKLKRVFPNIILNLFANFFKAKVLNKISLYLPTNDIQYLILRKK